MAKWRRKNHHKQRGINITRILSRDGDKCSLCGVKLDRKLKDYTHPMYVTFDHVQPASKGGLAELSNFRLAHRVCNERRGAKELSSLELHGCEDFENAP